MNTSTSPPHPTAKALFDALDLSESKQHGSGAKTKEQRCSGKKGLIRKRTLELGWRGRFSQAKEYPVTVGGVEFFVEQVQRGEIEETYGTGATVWPASLVLIKYLEMTYFAARAPPTTNNGHLLRVLDLGSGTGITSIAAALLMDGGLVTCTDGCDSVVKLASKNIQKVCSELADKADDDNAIVPFRLTGTTINVSKYMWGDGSMASNSFDLVMVADCVLPKLYPIEPLVLAIRDTLKRDSGVALLSYEHRFFPEYDPKTKFHDLAREYGLVVDVIPECEHDPIYSSSDIEIWKVTFANKTIC